MKKTTDVARAELLALLEGGNAHMTFEEAVADFPPEFINRNAPHTPYSFWHFVEHLRIAQWDILEFIRNPAHISPSYPEGYRPAPGARTDTTGWERSCRSFLADLAELQSIVRDQNVDLYAPLPHAPDYTICREILTVADHNAYHIGELAILRQVMNIWPAANQYLTGKPN
jgi:hypothetical protein